MKKKDILYEVLRKREENATEKEKPIYKKLNNTDAVKVCTAFLIEGCVIVPYNKLYIEEENDAKKLREYLENIRPCELYKILKEEYEVGRYKRYTTNVRQIILNPSPAIKKTLYTLYKDEKSSFKGREIYVSYKGPPLISILFSLGIFSEISLIWQIRGRDYLVKINKEKMRWIWPDIENFENDAFEYYESIREYEEYCKNRDKRRSDCKIDPSKMGVKGQRLAEALWILGFLHIEELRKAYKKDPEKIKEKIKNLSRVDWPLKGLENPPRKNLNQIKDRLLRLL